MSEINVPELSLVVLIGASGSGKSTFLRCINLLEMPDSGRIVVRGEEIRFRKKRGGTVPADRRQVERMRTRLGMVFQSFNLWPHRTVLGNVIEAPVHVLRQSRAEAIEIADEILRKVGLYEKRDVYPAYLSGGQQQRAAIARALAMRPDAMLFDEPTSALDPELVGEVLKVIRALATEPEILLFDEPTSALDPIATASIEELIAELRAKLTILIVTHNMQQAARVSDFTAYMYLGQIIEFGETSQIFLKPREQATEDYITGRFG